MPDFPTVVAPAWWIVTNFLVSLSVSCVLVAVAVDFNKFHAKNAERHKKSPVETGTMVGFLLLFYVLIHFRVGSLLTYPVVGSWPGYITTIIGLVLLVSGTIINIWGRVALSEQWSNQIKIYSGHHLVQTGPYRFVRHPLYGSLVVMFWGACLVYQNYIAFLVTFIIFVPAMYVRANQEEVLLGNVFEDYKSFQRGCGMLFPRINQFIRRSK